MEFQDIQFTSNYWVILLPVIAMAGDFITGYLNAWIHHDIQSSKMRIGAAHKGAELLALVLVWCVQLAIVLPVDVTAVMAIYLVFMEFNSIMENLDKMGVPVPAVFKKRVNNTLSQFDNGEKE